MYISSKAIVRLLSSNYGFQVTSLEKDIIEFVGEAIAQIGMDISVTTKIVDCVIRDFNFVLPCENIQLMNVYHKGKKLGTKNNKSSFIHSRDNELLKQEINQRLKARSQNIQISECNVAYDELVDDIINIEELMKDLVCLTEIPKSYDWYQEETICVKTNIESGYVRAEIKFINTDNENYPLISDEFKLIDYVTKYCVRILLQRGLKHSVITYQQAVVDESRALAKAKNNRKMQTIEQLERFRQRWTDMTYNIYKDTTTLMNNAI
jgi:hypothetical protein